MTTHTHTQTWSFQGPHHDGSIEPVCRVTARWDATELFWVARPDSLGTTVLFTIVSCPANDSRYRIMLRCPGKSSTPDGRGKSMLHHSGHIQHLASRNSLGDIYIFKKKKVSYYFFYIYIIIIDFLYRERVEEEKKNCRACICARTWTMAKAKLYARRIAIRDGEGKAVIHFRHRCAKKDSRFFLLLLPGGLDPANLLRRRVSFFVGGCVCFPPLVCAKIYRLPFALTLIWSQISSKEGKKEENGAFGFLICGKLGGRLQQRFLLSRINKKKRRRGRRPEQSTDRTEEDFSVYGRVIGSHLIQ